MYRFSKESKKRLLRAEQSLQLICFDAIESIDFKVLESYRTPQRQMQLLQEGRTKVKYSKHMYDPSKAIDIEPYPRPADGWKKERDLRRFYFLAGVMKRCADAREIKIRWGGDWDGDFDYNDNNFDDLFHYEIL